MGVEFENIDLKMVIKQLWEILSEYENSANVSDQMLARRSITLHNAMALIERGQESDGK